MIVSREILRDALALIERAEAALRNGWPEAAHDALGRARRLLSGYATVEAR